MAFDAQPDFETRMTSIRSGHLTANLPIRFTVRCFKGALQFIFPEILPPEAPCVLTLTVGIRRLACGAPTKTGQAAQVDAGYILAGGALMITAQALF